QVVGGVAGGRYRLEFPALALDHLAVPHLDVRPEVAVRAGFRIVLLAFEAWPRGAMPTLGIYRRAGCGLDRRDIHGMVAVGMGDQDMRHGFTAYRIEQRSCMGLIRRTRIDDRDLAPAHDVAHRAGEGERAGIVAQDAPHAGPCFLDDSRRKREVAVEGDVVVIGHAFLYRHSGMARKGQARNLDEMERDRKSTRLNSSHT